MFEEQYRKYFQEIQPSDALNEETFALMKEAQDHKASLPPKKLRWKPAVVIPAAGTAAAVLVAVIVGSFWLHNGRKVAEEDELMGSLDVFVSASDSAAAPGNDSNAQAEDALIGDDLPEDTGDPQEPLETEKVEEPSTSAPQEQPESDSPDGSTGDAASGTSPETMQPDTGTADPREPDIINDGTTVTYTSLREFLTTLAAKETPGYGSNYYNARELIIVPSRLPDNARFRHFHLNTETGKYSYSYLFTTGDKEYFLDIDVNAKPPKTLRDLNLQKEAIATEEIGTGKKGNQLFYLFGQNDYITVTLTEVNSVVALTEEEVATLLADFQLERCSLSNAVLDMKY